MPEDKAQAFDKIVASETPIVELAKEIVNEVNPLKAQ